MEKVNVKSIEAAEIILEKVVRRTPLQYNKRLSDLYEANIFLKREDLQGVRSFKIRGAYNKINSLLKGEKKRGIVAASTGNHAQGVAHSCFLLKIKGTIFMPTIISNQKIDRVKHFGGEFVEIKLVGNTFEDIAKAVLQASTVKVPAILLEQETDRLLAQLLNDIKKLGLNLEQYLSSTKRTPEDLRSEYSKRAEDDMKLEFILQKIAELEKITVEEREIEEAIQKAKSEEEKKHLEGNKYLLAAILRQQKTLDFLMNL